MRVAIQGFGQDALIQPSILCEWCRAEVHWPVNVPPRAPQHLSNAGTIAAI